MPIFTRKKAETPADGEAEEKGSPQKSEQPEKKKSFSFGFSKKNTSEAQSQDEESKKKDEVDSGEPSGAAPKKSIFKRIKSSSAGSEKVPEKTETDEAKPKSRGILKRIGFRKGETAEAGPGDGAEAEGSPSRAPEAENEARTPPRAKATPSRVRTGEPSDHADDEDTPQAGSPQKPSANRSIFKGASGDPAASTTVRTAGSARCCLNVERTGEMEPDVNLVSPLVRVHLVDEKTGTALSTTSKVHRQGRDAAGALMPLETHPYKLKDRQGNPLIANWHQKLIVAGVPPDRVLSEDVLVLLEILQMPSSFAKFNTEMWNFRGGYYRVAWGFLKLSAHKKQSAARDGSPALQGADDFKKYKMQLYRYFPPARALFGPAQAGGLEVFRCYSRLKALPVAARAPHKYPTFVELAVGTEPDPLGELQVFGDAPRPPLEQRLHYERKLGDLVRDGTLQEGAERLQSELGRVPCEDLLDGMKVQDEEEADEEAGQDEEEDTEEGGYVARPPGANAEVPNKLGKRLTASPNGVLFAAFSHSGTFLAAVCADPLMFALRVYHVHSALCTAHFTGHHAFVYDLAWSPDDTTLLTASGDFSAKLWTVVEAAEAGGQGKRKSMFADIKKRKTVFDADPKKRRGSIFGEGGVEQLGPPKHAALTFQHSCFVYAAQYHPTAHHRIVATGAYDKTVRLFSRVTGEVLRELPVHRACVNSLAFDAAGKRLYSGDGEGVLKEFACDGRKAGSSTLKLLRSSNELEGEAVSHLKVHPMGRKLIVLTKASRMSAVDLKLFAVSQEYIGVRCTAHPLKFAVSPDGRFIVCGSEDGRVLLWESDSAQIHPLPAMQIGSDIVYGVAWNEGYQMLALSRNMPSLPLAIYTWDRHRAAAIHVKEKTATQEKARTRWGMMEKSVSKPEVPDQLTPAKVAEMLASIRSSKEQLMQRVDVSVRKSREVKALAQARPKEDDDEWLQTIDEKDDEVPAQPVALIGEAAPEELARSVSDKLEALAIERDREEALEKEVTRQSTTEKADRGYGLDAELSHNPWDDAGAGKLVEGPKGSGSRRVEQGEGAGFGLDAELEAEEKGGSSKADETLDLGGGKERHGLDALRDEPKEEKVLDSIESIDGGKAGKAEAAGFGLDAELDAEEAPVPSKPAIGKGSGGEKGASGLFGLGAEQDSTLDKEEKKSEPAQKVSTIEDDLVEEVLDEEGLFGDVKKEGKGESKREQSGKSGGFGLEGDSEIEDLINEAKTPEKKKDDSAVEAFGLDAEDL